MLHIPQAFEFRTSKVLIQKTDQGLLIQPLVKKSISEVLDEMEPLGVEDEFPDVRDGLLPPKDIDL